MAGAGSLSLEIAQAKESLTTPPRLMGGSCEVPESFAAEVAKIPHLSQLVDSDSEAKEDATKELAKLAKESEHPAASACCRGGGSWSGGV